MAEFPELLNEYVRKARKQHSCCECGNTIVKGEKYCYISGKWNGAFDSFKQCLPCNDAFSDAMDMGFDVEFCPSYGGLHAWMHDMASE